MSLKILVTNDDGIDAVGLEYLVEHAKKYGEVVVVAPLVEQSAKSQAIEVRKKVLCTKVDKFPGVLAYAFDSTPTDCVRFARYGLHLDFDLILSGINKGYNVGEDIWYSGTVAVAFEAKSLHAKAIAFSVIKSSNEGFKYFDETMEYILNNNLFDICDTYNVNLPSKAKGIKITRQGGNNFNTFYEEREKDMYMQCGDWVNDEDIDKTYIDNIAINQGYISIMPLTADRTDINAFNELLKK